MFNVAVQLLINVVILIKTVFYLKLKFILKINPKLCTFKTRNKFLKNLWQPCILLVVLHNTKLKQNCYLTWILRTLAKISNSSAVLHVFNTN